MEKTEQTEAAIAAVAQSECFLPKLSHLPADRVGAVALARKAVQIFAAEEVRESGHTLEPPLSAPAGRRGKMAFLFASLRILLSASTSAFQALRRSSWWLTK